MCLGISKDKPRTFRSSLSSTIESNCHAFCSSLSITTEAIVLLYSNLIVIIIFFYYRNNAGQGPQEEWEE